VSLSSIETNEPDGSIASPLNESSDLDLRREVDDRALEGPSE
jgi:hypothetical protein